MIGERIDTNIAGGMDFPLPRMVPVRQIFPLPRLEDLAGTIRDQFARPEIRSRIRSGMSVAVGCGSRGIANIAECAKLVVSELKSLGAHPFIFPAMGSHGGGTAEGQRELLAGFGITESAVGCPVRSCMDVIELGKLDDGTSVFMDSLAAAADAVVVIARIKPHTNFRAPTESGMLKMMSIGMGKIAGATMLHSCGFDRFGEVLPKVAAFIMERRNFLFGVAMVENAADETAHVEIVPANRVFDREKELLIMARSLMPRLQFDEIDVLVVDRMGKDISGAGMDPNITGRNCRLIEWETKPLIKKIAVLGLTEESLGNAAGLGAADVTTMRLYKALDISKTYANTIAATYLDGCAIPIIMNTDEEAVRLAVKTLVRVKPEEARIVRIADTQSLIDIQVSLSMLPFVEANRGLFEVRGEADDFRFDADGSLGPFPPSHSQSYNHIHTDSHTDSRSR